MNTKVLSSISDPRYLRLLQKCSTMDQLKQIHAQIMASGLSPFSYISSKLLAFCAISDAGDINYAHTIFKQISAPAVFDFNTMIMGYSKTSKLEFGLSIYAQMRTRGLRPDHRTFPVLAKSCACVSSLFQVHGQIIKFGHGSDVYVISSLIWNYSKLEAIQPAHQVFDESSYRNVVCYTSLITGYCSNGLVEDAHKVFEEMPEKNDVSYSAMISGFVRNGLCYEAIDLFRKLKEDANMKPCRSAFVCILIACGALGALDEGKHVHSLLTENSLDRELEIGTTLIDFYAKCGNIEKAQEVFRKMPSKDVATWSVMILGLAMNGKNEKALDLFVEMEKTGPVPNAITFIGVLAACNHQDLVTEAWPLFGKMTKVYGLSPMIEHYGCMVDLLVRAGQIERAEILINCMPMEADGAIWGSFLNGCMINNRMQLGERAGKLLIELEPQHSGRYVLLSNLYATLGSWENAIRLRRMMEERKVAPTRGWSFIEVDGVTYTFAVDDKYHYEWRHIRKLTAELNKVGYVYRENSRMPNYDDGRYWTLWKLPMFGCTDASQVLHDIEECKKSYPNAYIRCLAFDNVKQVQCLSFVIQKLTTD